MQSLSHHPARSVLKWALWHFFLNPNVLRVSSPASSSSGKSFHCVPITFPLRLTHNEALCHCHIALPSCRSLRNALKVIVTDEMGEGWRELRWGKKEGTNIEINGKQNTLWQTMEEIRVIAYCISGHYKILVSNWLFSIENKKAVKNMYTVVSATEIVVWFKDVHGVAFTVIWIIAAVRQKRTMLWVFAGRTQNCAYYILFLLCTQKENKRYLTAVFLFLCIACLFCYTFPKPSSVSPFAVILNWHLLHTEVYSGTVVSCETWPRQTLELILHHQQGPEREGDLPQQWGRGRGNHVGMSGWMGHVTPTLVGHVSLNVITAIITAYMMKCQKSADAECSHPHWGREGVCVHVHVMILWGLLH